jgi:hypothetical protein
MKMTEFDDARLAEEVGHEPTVYCLKQDNDGHWYVIDLDEEDNFLTWIDDTENDRESEYDFSDCVIGGNPTLVKFPSYWIAS